jgi:hypothetical protein
MGILTELLVNERIQDIERETAAHRSLEVEPISGGSRPAWRRHGGAAARRLSVALAGLAAELDPAICRPSYGRE